MVFQVYSEINFTEIGKNIAKEFWLARVAERFVKEREKKVPTLELYNNADKAVEVPTRCAEGFEANMEICSHKIDLHKNIRTVKGTHVQACEIFFGPPYRTPNSRETCRISVRV